MVGAEGGHDWWHIYRVWNNAKVIAKEEGGVDLLVVELSALLHDIADAKFHLGNEEVGAQVAKEFLHSLDLPSQKLKHVVAIIRNISYRSQLQGVQFFSREFGIVQDADRLDAMGAIGIARAFNYGGFRNRLIYDPNIRPISVIDKPTYTSSIAPTINHFYEKLLLLVDHMHTKTGKRMAKGRHDFMKLYLDQFFHEWPDENS